MSLTLARIWKTASLAASGFAGDRPLFVFDYALRFFRVAVLLALWRSILGRPGADPGLSLGTLLTYTLIAEAFHEQMNVRTTLLESLWDGSIAVRLLQPAPLVVHFGGDMLGRWLLNFALFSLPLLLAAPALGASPAPASLAAGLLFVPSLALAVAVGLAIEFICGALMVATEQNMWAFSRMRTAVVALLSGSVLPLAVFPWGLGGVFEWLPFAATASAPLRIYTGQGDAGLLARQLFWALALWPLAGYAWRRSREKLVGYGG